MEVRAAVQALSFKGTWGMCQLPHAEAGRVSFPVGQLKGGVELTPKELHHKRKKEEWKRLRRARRVEKLAEQAREQARLAGLREPRRREGLCSFEKYKLAKEKGEVVQAEEWKSGVKGKTTLMSKFEAEFAMRVRVAVNSIKPSTTTTSEHDDGDVAENSTTFRGDSHSGGSLGEAEDVSDDWLLAYGRRGNGDVSLPGIHSESIADDGAVKRTNRSIRITNDGNLEVQRNERTAERVVTTNSQSRRDEILGSAFSEEGEPAFSEEDERLARTSTTNSSSRPELRFIDHSFNLIPSGTKTASSDLYKNGDDMHNRDNTGASTASDESQDALDMRELRDWRIKPKTPRLKDRSVGRLIMERRKGGSLSSIPDENSDNLTSDTHDILLALHEDVTSEVWRKPVDEREQLEWLVQELLQAGKKQKFFLSRLMHGARLKWTDGRLLELVKMLGARREWRRAMEVVHWVHSREHFSHCRNRYVCTTLLAVLGKCLRPVEALNVFNVMREEHSTYPDMAAYHSVAVTLGKAGHLTQLLSLIESLKEGPMKKSVRGSPRQLNWNGRLEPDIVVYNAVINACGPHRQWEGVEWVFQQMQSAGIRPNSTTYGLAIEVMVKSGQCDKAWRYYEIMERGGFLPNALTFKALVEALGTAGEVDMAIEMVEEMERRGVLECAGVYYALASALCAAGRLSEALVQVDKLLKLPSRKPDVVTFTGLIRTCDKAGRWQDAISLFNRMQHVCALNVGTYNIMIALYGRHRLFEEARDIFELVKKGRHKNGRFPHDNSRLCPTEHTYESMLGACAASEDWGYFQVVLEEFHTRGFHLDFRRHAWFISPIVKARQESLIHLMAKRLQRPGEPPSADLYRFLLPLLSIHGYYTLVVNYLNVILEHGVALNTPEWSSIIGNALEQLPMVDAEQFLCTKVTATELDDSVLVKELLQCLASVGANKKVGRLVSLLGLEVGELVSSADATLGDSRLLPQEVENVSSGVLENKSSLENKQVEKMTQIQEVYLKDVPLVHNDVAVKGLDDGFQFHVRFQDARQKRGEVLCGPRTVGQDLGWNSRNG